MQEEEDPFIGFLPPNNTNHAGEGFVSFSAGLNSSLKTNAVLKNKATIVFDANNPIVTNEFSNKLDLDKPESEVFPLDDTSQNHFTLAWSGNDSGSGIAGYSIYVMENDTALRAWKINTPTTSAEFIGTIGSRYKFFSIATDNVSLREETPDQFDASTQIVVHSEEFELLKNEIQIYPTPVDDKLTVSLQQAPCGMYAVELLNMNGQVSYSQLHDNLSLSKGIQIDVSGLHSGQYFIRIIYGSTSESRKIVIR